MREVPVFPGEDEAQSSSRGVPRAIEWDLGVHCHDGAGTDIPELN